MLRASLSSVSPLSSPMRCLLLILAAGVVYAAEPVKLVVELAPIKGIHVGGLLGRALLANQNGRLKTFIGNEASRPIHIFSPRKAEANFAGDWNGGDRGLACDPSRISEFQEGVDKAIEYAVTLGCRQIHCMAGLRPRAVNDQKMRETYLANLAFAR